MIKVTLKTIAKEFGVSVSTVSKALKDSPDIGKETREKIKAYAEMYNYKPNSFALNLRSQKSNVIGVVVPSLIHHFFSEVISGIEREANQAGYNVMICVSDESVSKEINNINLLTNARVDGIIMSIAKESLRYGKINHINRLIEQDLPVVLFDRVHKTLACDKVLADDVMGGYLATKHLLKEGRNRIALLTTPDHLEIGNKRRRGYENALKEYNRSVDEEMIVEVDERNSITNQIREVFEGDRLPDAVFAVNEVYAVKCLKIALNQDLSIPKDLSIIGYTNGIISKYSTPTLSSVIQHGYKMGQESARLLLKRLNSKERKKPETRIISADLKFRESTLDLK